VFPLHEAIQGKDVEVEWMPFELRPEPHPTLRPEGDYLPRAWQQSVYPIARRMGVPITLPPVSPQPHTHLAFEGYQYARDHGMPSRRRSAATAGPTLGMSSRVATSSAAPALPAVRRRDGRFIFVAPFLPPVVAGATCGPFYGRGGCQRHRGLQ
jgi:hypothetical protein